MCGRPKIVQSDPAADAAKAAEQAQIAANLDAAQRKKRVARDQLQSTASVLGSAASPLGSSVLSQGQ